MGGQNRIQVIKKEKYMIPLCSTRHDNGHTSTYIRKQQTTAVLSILIDIHRHNLRPLLIYQKCSTYLAVLCVNQPVTAGQCILCRPRPSKEEGKACVPASHSL